MSRPYIGDPDSTPSPSQAKKRPNQTKEFWFGVCCDYKQQSEAAKEEGKKLTQRDFIRTFASLDLTEATFSRKYAKYLKGDLKPSKAKRQREIRWPIAERVMVTLLSQPKFANKTQDKKQDLARMVGEQLGKVSAFRASITWIKDVERRNAAEIAAKSVASSANQAGNSRDELAASPAIKGVECDQEGSSTVTYQAILSRCRGGEGSVIDDDGDCKRTAVLAAETIDSDSKVLADQESFDDHEDVINFAEIDLSDGTAQTLVTVGNDAFFEADGFSHTSSKDLSNQVNGTHSTLDLLYRLVDDTNLRPIRPPVARDIQDTDVNPISNQPADSIDDQDTAMDTIETWNITNDSVTANRTNGSPSPNGIKKESTDELQVLLQRLETSGLDCISEMGNSDSADTSNDEKTDNPSPNLVTDGFAIDESQINIAVDDNFDFETDEFGFKSQDPTMLVVEALNLRDEGHDPRFSILLLQQALDIHTERSADDELETAEFCKQIGNMHRDQGDLKAALTYHLRALKILTRVSPGRPTQRMCFSVGELYGRLGDWATRAVCLKRAGTLVTTDNYGRGDFAFGVGDHWYFYEEDRYSSEELQDLFEDVNARYSENFIERCWYVISAHRKVVHLCCVIGLLVLSFLIAIDNFYGKSLIPTVCQAREGVSVEDLQETLQGLIINQRST